MNLEQQTSFLRKDLRRRASALSAILADLGTAEEALFEDVIVVVDWSEIHSYICGGGPPRSDYLFALTVEDERVNGAHQAALSFLFEVFPSQLVLLPPHVRELMWFVEAAQRFADLREVDAQLLKGLYERVDSEAVETIQRLHSEWKLNHAGKSPGDQELRQIFSRLEKGDGEALRRWLTQAFAPMFLLGRWLSIDSVKDLGRLLDAGANARPRVQFLKDYDQKLNEKLSRDTADTTAWTRELNPHPSKAKGLVSNDARALAYLQVLNCDLHLRDTTQLLFVTRSEDILGALRKRPEWFSCLADRYSTATMLELPIEGHRPSSIVRDWVYFFELGAAWRGGQNPRTELQRRLDSVRAMLASLPTGPSHLSAANKILARYLETDAGLLNNIQALSSAQNAKFHVNRAKRGAGATDRSLIDFLRFVTAPDEFVAVRRELQDQMKELVDRINAVLPPQPAANEPSRYRPLLRSILDFVSPELLVRDIGSADLRQAASELLYGIKNGDRIVAATTRLSKQLQALNEDPSTKEPLTWLVYALHAYLYQSYSKARGLVLSPDVKRLPGLNQVVRMLIVADYWLVEHETLRKVDEVLNDLCRLDVVLKTPLIRLVVLNARVQLELHASYEHDEDPESFRRGASSDDSCLQSCWEDLRAAFERVDASRLPEALRGSVLSQLVHASARLTAADGFLEEPADENDDPVVGGDDDLYSVEEDLKIDDNGEAEIAVGVSLEFAERYVSKLCEFCEAHLADSAIDPLVLVSCHDALAYYHFKKACVEQASARADSVSNESLAAARQQLLLADDLLPPANINTVDSSYQRVLLKTHWDLIDRIPL